MRLCCISSLDLVLTGVVVDGIFPDYYYKLLKNRQITNTQYSILKNLWEFSLSQIVEYMNNLKPNRLSLVKWGTTSNLMSLSSVTKIPFKAAVVKLEHYGLVKIYRRRGNIAGIELSARLFKKTIETEVLNKHSTNLISIMYPNRFTAYDLMRIGKRFGNEIMCHRRFVNVRNPVFYKYYDGDSMEIVRIPIIFEDRKQMIEHPIEREPFIGIRKPIIERVPIISKRTTRKINFNAKKYRGLTDSQKHEIEQIAHLGQRVIDRKLERFKDIQSKVYTEDELDCLYEFVPYYENLICEHCGIIEYSLLNNKRFPKRSKNWTALYKVFTLCKEKGWDYKIYLESQFKSYKNWGADSKATVKYPAPNMLYSERAIVAYESYIYDNQTSYQNEGYDIKAQSNNVGDYKQQVTKRVEKSIRAVLRDMKSWTSKYCTLFNNVDTEKYDLVSVMKTKSIFDRWDDPDIPCIEYLSQVPDILDLVNSKRGISDGIDSKILDLESLLGNSVKMEIVSEVVKSLEKKHKMPDFVSVSEIPNILMGSDTIESDILW